MMPVLFLTQTGWLVAATMIAALLVSVAAPAAALGNDDAKAALKRAGCPYVLKDKRGNVVTNLCF